MQIVFTGLDELKRTLETRLNSEEIRDEALLKAAGYFKEELEENVYSYGLKERSGKSKESFVVDKEIVNGQLRVGLSNQNNDAFYLYFHEYGTSKMRARPFMRPTFEREKQKIIDTMARVLREKLML